MDQCCGLDREDPALFIRLWGQPTSSIPHKAAIEGGGDSEREAVNQKREGVFASKSMWMEAHIPFMPFPESCC